MQLFESMTPLNRVGETEHIAPAAVFFASDDSKWITRQTLLIAEGLRKKATAFFAVTKATSVSVEKDSCQA